LSGAAEQPGGNAGSNLGGKDASRVEASIMRRTSDPAIRTASVPLGNPRGRPEAGGLGANWLHGSHSATSADLRNKRIPSSLDGRPIHRWVEQPVANTPREAKDEQGAAARLRQRDVLRVLETWKPGSVGLLGCEHRGGHLPERSDVEVSHGITGWHLVEQQRQPGEHPAVTAAPEDLLAVRRAMPMNRSSR